MITELAHIHFVGADPLARAAVSRRARTLFHKSPLKAENSAADSVEVEPFLEWLLERADLDASQYQPKPLQRRLGACLRALRTSSMERAKELIVGNPILLWRALNAVLIGVSEFFRDPATFDYLGKTVLPHLVRERGGLRVLSAGCSTGEELYSVAIQLDELGALKFSKLVGIDCRRDAIAHARHGMYSSGDLSRMSPERRRKYFERRNEWMVLRSDVRDRTRWEMRDLLTCRDGGEWDLILCRNVAIYLDREAATRLWARLASQLAPGGVLVTGRAERLSGLSLRRLAPSVYCRVRS